MNTNFKVFGLTRLDIKPESTAPEADALTTRPSELLCSSSEEDVSFVEKQSKKTNYFASCPLRCQATACRINVNSSKAQTSLLKHHVV